MKKKKRLDAMVQPYQFPYIVLDLFVISEWIS